MNIDGHPRIRFANDITTNTIWGMPLWACWLLIALLLIISGMFSASENAYTNCNKYHFKAEAEKGSKVSKLITRLVEKFDDTLITILISSNTIQTIMGFLSALLWVNICEYYGLGSVTEALLSTVMMGVLFYIVSDTIPKVISKAIPNQMAILMAYPLTFIQIILYPFVFLFRCLLKLVHKIFKSKDENLLSKEDLLSQVDIAVSDESIVEDEEIEEKLFENDEKEIINNVLSFDKRLVKDVYVPMRKVFSLPIDDLTVDVVNKVIIEEDYSRIPIYDEKKTNIVGILVIKSYFEEYCLDPHLSIPSILEDVIKIDANMALDEAFEKLNTSKVHLGVVMNKNRTIGVISMEDILEEIVHDIDEEPTLEEEEN